ncbi:MAG: nucleoid-associated protein [Chloroflexota bacterium]|nr:YbaB/EbfC family nucleoid-associated protein [Caldilinea sp.]GIK75818.1 MAG: nucleoid-associated protein [Chloroflexota bacterium]
MSKKRGFGGGGRGGFGGGFGGGMPNMGSLMSQVQKLQEEMEKTQAALAAEEITVSAGGAVTIVVTGAREFKSVTIKPEVVDPDDVEMLQDLLLAAFNDALAQVKQLEEERMGSLTGGMGLPPGLF